MHLLRVGLGELKNKINTEQAVAEQMGLITSGRIFCSRLFSHGLSQFIMSVFFGYEAA